MSQRVPLLERAPWKANRFPEARWVQWHELMHSLSASLVALSTLALAWLAPTAAFACAATPCGYGTQMVLPESRVVPANYGEITVYDTSNDVFDTRYRVRIWEKSSPEEVLFTGEIAGRDLAYSGFGSLLTSGKRYVIEAAPQCQPGASAEWAAFSAPKQMEVEVGPVAPPPTGLGALKLVHSGREIVPVWFDYCASDLEAGVADVRLDLASVPEAWRDALTNYQLIVDGEPFSWISGFYSEQAHPGFARAAYFGKPGDFRAWTACSDQPPHVQLNPRTSGGLAPGEHEVWVRARVPSSEPHTIESEHLTVNLSCGAEQQPARSEYRDSDTPAPSSAPERNGDGCSVTHGPSQHVHAALLLVAGGLLLTLRSRRRIRR